MAKRQKVKVDIVSVSKLANVSPATVSRALNHPEIVSHATRKRVESAIRTSGYIRNRAAQAMHGRRSATIGLVVPTIDYAIFAEVIQAFNDAVSEQGFTLLIASHGYDLDVEYTVICKLLEHRVDGVAMIGLEHAPKTLTVLESHDVPRITIWRYAPDAALPCIGADNEEAAKLAISHLIMMGHRDIGMIFPSSAGNDRARARREATLQTLDAHGISVPDRWQIEAPYSLPLAKAAGIDLLRQDDRPTALMCGNDVLAQGAVFGALNLGLKVPDDISVIGIGDFAGAADMEPSLTTVRIPARRIGIGAGEHLVAAILETDRSGPILREKIPLDLIMRSTTAPPRRRDGGP